MQCVLFDVEQNKCSVASLLPVQCTNPVMTSFRSRVYVTCNDVSQTAAGFRCFENDLNFDRWTEISKPLSLNLSAYITNDISHENLSRLITKSPLSCTAVNNSILVTMLVGNVTISQYYDVASSRWKASLKSAKLNKNADFPIKDFHVLVFNK
uniref:Uncharacterized protein n=1 Tax=Ciona savignyi TaxID=51511 RepID=H2YZQ9_CIOSA